MRTRKLSEIIRNLDNSTKEDASGEAAKHPAKHPKSDDLDQIYEDSGKKHRNWVAHLDHVYENITHPLILIAVFFVIFIIFIWARYRGINYPNNLFYKQVHEDTGTMLTYIATVVLTSIVTQFFEVRKKNQGK